MSPATSLSIGQQQRLCLAHGLAVEPEIILGDEPTSALDPISSQHIEGRLLDLKKQYTTVIVTHTLRQAKRLADYVILYLLKKKGEVGCFGRASPAQNTPHPVLLKRYVIFMYLGEVVEAGLAKEVFNNPKQERTRAYLEGQF